MLKFCPNCGVKLESEFRFCPECGIDLRKVAEQTDAKSVSENSTSSSDKIGGAVLICEICGEENSPSNIVCAGCGVKLNNPNPVAAKHVEKAAPTSANKISKAQKQSNKHSNTASVSNKKPISQNQSVKKLNKTKVITVVAIGLGVALLILIFSGALDFIISPTPKVAQTGVQNGGENQSSGVDLGSIQKINQLEQVVKANPQDTSAILDLAHAKNDANLFEEAIENYKQYLALVPRDPDARIDMGICYYNLKNYDVAMKEMEQAIKIDPKHQIGYLDLGIVSLTKGDLAGSKQWLQKAVALDPGSEYGKKATELLQSHSTNQGGN